MSNTKAIQGRGKNLKPLFIERYKNILNERYEEFIKYSFSYLRKCIRINTLKKDVEYVKKRLEKEWNLISIPWCKEGFYISHKKENRFDIGNLLEHQLGYIYVQDAASMIPPIVLNPNPGEIVLDMCAAPGSKTTQIAQYMKNRGIVVANDVDLNRIIALGMNLQRCGVSNAMIVLRHNRRFSQIFDKVLIDAPCSATGTIRRSYNALEMWSPNFVKRMAANQKMLIQQGFNVLKKGGVLVYSTCSLEPEENEEVISFFLEKNKDAELEDIHLKGIKRSPAIQEFKGRKYNSDVRRCLRIWPQDNDTEGFFVAKIRKKN